MKEELEKYDSVRWAEAFVLNPVGTEGLMRIQTVSMKIRVRKTVLADFERRDRMGQTSY